ncbi:MAG: hypothetical protein K2P70_07435 [Hyphomonadaceae bacterium]|nr:hypothetical protein [Hyphomonadaceae bacterium]
MKWWAIPFLLVGPPLFLYGMAADRDGLIFDLSFVAGGILTLMGALLLIFLPYSGSRDEQRRTGQQDLVGTAVVVGVLALIISVLVAVNRFA